MILRSARPVPRHRPAVLAAALAVGLVGSATPVVAQAGFTQPRVSIHTVAIANGLRRLEPAGKLLALELASLSQG
jgi:hypothetical protein